MINRSSFLKVAAAAGVVLASLGTAHAAGNVAFSIGANIAPGVSVGVSNAPYYAAPAYYPPAPVYYSQPVAPVYYQPAPVYYQPSVYVAPAVVYSRPYAYRYGHRHYRY